MAKAMLIDTDFCLECNACSVECRRNNDVPVGREITWTTIDHHETGEFPNVQAFTIKSACNHCTEAACMSVCPVGAISKPDGVHTVVNHEECVSCGACQMACPFSIPQYGNPRGTSQKCRFCYGTKAEGDATACASACPFGAITYGERDELIAIGKERVAHLVQKGNADAVLYGESELGGLNTLYVMAAPPSAYGLPENPVAYGSQQELAAALAAKAEPNAPAPKWVVPSLWGGFAGIGIAGAAALGWMIRRRMSAQAQDQAKSNE